MTTTPTYGTRKLAGIALGVTIGVVAYAALRGRASIFGVPLPVHLDRLIVPGCLLLTGTSRLFLRAAFPKRFPDTASERLRQAVFGATQIVGGVGLALRNGLGVLLLLLAAAAIILTWLRLPGRVFRSSPV